jgi:hypothetical protein
MFPTRESLVSDIPAGAGEGKIAYLFSSVIYFCYFRHDFIIVVCRNADPAEPLTKSAMDI